MLAVVAQVLIGVVYVNAMEWGVHRFVLHGLGRKKTSRWSFHWHEHHKKARRHNMVDDQYTGGSWLRAIWRREQTAQTKEVVGLLLGSLVHVPLLFVAPAFALTVWLGAATYYVVHRKSHVDPAWAAKHLPWHVEHHMGKDQDANWCVTWPLMDWIMGTRLHATDSPPRTAAAGTVVDHADGI